jgi:hypothetical protein
METIPGAGADDQAHPPRAAAPLSKAARSPGQRPGALRAEPSSPACGSGRACPEGCVTQGWRVTATCLAPRKPDANSDRPRADTFSRRFFEKTPGASGASHRRPQADRFFNATTQRRNDVVPLPGRCKPPSLETGSGYARIWKSAQVVQLAWASLRLCVVALKPEGRGACGFARATTPSNLNCGAR